MNVISGYRWLSKMSLCILRSRAWLPLSPLVASTTARPLAAPVARHARAAVLIGRDAALIRAALEAAGVPLLEAQSMEQAVALATQRAHAGDAVLMSPACASFDMFRNYPHRAEVFRAAVRAIADDAGIALEVAG